jgi:hypothetical protein
MGLGIAKVDEETISQQLGDMSIKACDDLGADALIRTDHLSEVLRIEPSRQGRGIY